MTANRYFQLDVFTERAGGGNPLGVVVAADDWSDAAMQAFAAWTDLVETTFLLQPSEPGADYRVRIFTPQREIAFAGHPSIGSAHAALEAGVAKATDGQLVQQCAAGRLPIRVWDPRSGSSANPVGTEVPSTTARQLSVQSPRSRIVSLGVDAEGRLARVLADVGIGVLGPALVEGGRRWWLCELASETAVRTWQPDHEAIKALALDSDSLGLCVFARCHGSDYELCVRAFPAGVGIVEDPASGAANGLIAACIAEREPHGALARGYAVSQGREIGHDARIIVAIDSDGSTWVGGQTQTVVVGEVHWPRT